MPRMPDESRPEYVQRVLARMLPSLGDELEATYFFLKNLPESLRPQGVKVAESLRMRMERIHMLLKEVENVPKRRSGQGSESSNEHGEREPERRRDEVRPTVRPYANYDYPERKESPFEESVTGPRNTGSGSRD